jgi:hypothetical protein
MATLSQPSSVSPSVGNGGMEELLPLVKQLTDPEQVTNSLLCSRIDRQQLSEVEVINFAASAKRCFLPSFPLLSILSERSRLAGALEKARKLP